LVIDQVVADSPAAKGGIKNNDILLEFNGKPVPNNVQEFVRSIHDIKADSKVDAVVLRKGKKETIKGLTCPRKSRSASVDFPRLKADFPPSAAQGKAVALAGAASAARLFPRPTA
jgi:Trypsin-like serine proteases, typically periplasmic, contain C-terminal PDZ domain